MHLLSIGRAVNPHRQLEVIRLRQPHHRVHMVEIVRVRRSRIVIQPRAMALEVGTGSAANAGEHDHDDGETLGLADLENQPGITQRITPEQFPLRVG